MSARSKVLKIDLEKAVHLEWAIQNAVRETPPLETLLLNAPKYGCLGPVFP